MASCHHFGGHSSFLWETTHDLSPESAGSSVEGQAPLWRPQKWRTISLPLGCEDFQNGFKWLKRCVTARPLWVFHFSHSPLWVLSHLNSRRGTVQLQVAGIPSGQVAGTPLGPVQTQVYKPRLKEPAPHRGRRGPNTKSSKWGLFWCEWKHPSVNPWQQQTSSLRSDSMAST